MSLSSFKATISNPKTTKSNYTLFLGLVFSASISIHAQAVQPMTETDLEVVSATTGSNILNIMGASQAGLTIDDSGLPLTKKVSSALSNQAFQEGEAIQPVAQEQINEIEKNTLVPRETPTESQLSSASQTRILKLNEQTRGEAAVFKTSSEISYKTSNVHHEMRELDNNGIAVERDMMIDLLKLENLSGDHLDPNRSAGSIYLSNWRSQGDTRIFEVK